jgi:tetratricopeptide (TPR) repeat protein
MHLASAALLMLALLLAPGARSVAQAPPAAVTQAMARRDAGDLAGAIRLLDAHVAQQPRDVEAVRLLAQTLYWAGRTADARRTYQIGIQLQPDDHRLRLEYGRMLAETGDYTAARDVIAPVQRDADTRAWADALLGTIAYWDGDLSQAQSLLRRALGAEPSLDEARRQLGEIAALSAPWVSLTGDLRSDDQPLLRTDGRVTAGRGLTPALRVMGGITAGRLQSGDSLALSTLAPEVGATHYLPRLRLDTEGAVGLFQRGDAVSDWTGRAQLGIRLPRRVTVRGSVAREPYLYTLASVRTPVITRTAAAVVALDSPGGWMAEASVQRAWYPDDNTIATSYAWALAPVVRTRRGRLQVGYGASSQDAAANRFVPARRGAGAGLPGSQLEGVYAPYYTPLQLTVHSALASAELRLGPATIRTSGTYGVRASDVVAVHRVGGGLGAPPVVSTFERRSFSPWTVRAGLDAAASPDVSVAMRAEVTRTVYYTATTARAQVTYRLASAAVRRATAR